MDQKNIVKRAVPFILSLAALYFILTLLNNMDLSGPTKTVTFNEIVDIVEHGNLSEISIQTTGEVWGKFKVPLDEKMFFEGRINPSDQELLTALLLKLEPRPKIRKTEPSQFFSNIFTFIIFATTLLVLFILFSLIRSTLKSSSGPSVRGGGIDFFNFTKTKGASEELRKERFTDIAGIDEAKEELKEIIDFLKNPSRYTRLGARIPKGVLLHGPPGVGKTLLAKAVAGEAGVKFFSLAGSEFVEVYVGVGASRVRNLFEKARTNAPCIIFIDEIDAMGSKRSSENGAPHNEREQTLNQFLVEMDGFENNNGLIIIAATNRDDKLDEALTRPGRFDRRVFVSLPDIKGREQILGIHTRNLKLAGDVNLKQLAKLIPGFSGADIANFANEAALAASKDSQHSVSMKYFELAKDKIITGLENKSLSSVMSEEEKRVTAVHEAGHALVAVMMPGADPLHKVSIIPRGRALGITSQMPEKDRYNYSEEYLFENLCILYGGRMAEKKILGRITAGAQNDIERATDLARTMVTELGMSELGSINFRVKGQFLSEISEDTKQKVDSAITALLKKAEKESEKIIDANREKLIRIFKALIERETLDRAEIEKLIKEP